MSDIDRTIEKLKRETQTKAEKQADNTVSELESIVRASNVQLGKRSEKITEAVQQIMRLQANQSAKEIRQSMKSLNELEGEIGNIKDKKEQDVLRQVMQKSKAETSRKGSIGRSALQSIGGGIARRIPSPSTMAVGAAGLTGNPVLLGLTSFLTNRAQDLRSKSKERKDQLKERKQNKLQMLEQIRMSEDNGGGEEKHEEKQAKQLEQQTSVQTRQLKETSELSPILTRIRDVLEMQLTEEQRASLRQLENKREQKRRAKSMARDARGRFISQKRATEAASGDDGISAGEVSLGILGAKGILSGLKSAILPILGLGRFLMSIPGMKGLTGMLKKAPAILPKVGRILRVLGKFFVILGPLKAAFDGVRELIETGSVVDAISEFGASLTEFFTFGLVDKEKLREPFDNMIEGFSNIFSNPREAIQKILGSVGNIGNMIGESLADLLFGERGQGGVFGAISGWFGGLDFTSMKGIADSVPKIIDKVLSWVGMITSGVLEFFGFEKLGDKVAEFFGEGSPLNKLWDSIKSAFDLIKDFFVETIPTFWNKGMETAVGWLKSIPQKIIDMMPDSVASFLGLKQEGDDGPTAHDVDERNLRDKSMEELKKRQVELQRMRTGMIERDMPFGDIEAEFSAVQNMIARRKSSNRFPVGKKLSLTGSGESEFMSLSDFNMTSPAMLQKGKLMDNVSEERRQKAGEGTQVIVNQMKNETNNTQMGGGNNGPSLVAPTTTRNNESTIQKASEKDFDGSL